MAKPLESLHSRRMKAVKVSALVALFVLVSFSPWSKKEVSAPAFASTYKAAASPGTFSQSSKVVDSRFGYQ